jgi:hypothetical protein
MELVLSDLKPIAKHNIQRIEYELNVFKNIKL